MTFESHLNDGRELLISHVEPRDAAEIVAYVNRVSGESDFLTFGGGEFGISVEDETKFIADLEGGLHNFMLKGVVEGQIISACVVFRSGQIGGSRPKRPRVQHIGEFGITVVRSHWGLGIGKRMTLAMLEVARDVGITKVNLKVREDNSNAIHLYESVGFKREGVTVRALRIDDRYFAHVMMGICID